MDTKNNTISKLLLICALLLGLLLTGCNMPAPASNASAEGMQNTLAAQTVVARLTEIAEGDNGSEQPTSTPQPTNTPAPTSTPEPTSTPTPKPTNTPEPTATQRPCNWAQFIKDMTVADSAQFIPGTEFTKVWRLQNVGSCTWNKDYDITFDGGDKLSGSTVSMPEKVSPGEFVDIAIPMQAPNSTGTYKGYWVLRDDDGREFGIGGSRDMPFWVEIKVVSSPAYEYNFAANFCDATWKSDNATLYCSGTDAGYTNYVQFTKKLVMEGGKEEDEAALIVNVGEENRVRGTYPAYTVQNGDHFLARIGCVQDSSDCHVKVILRYVIKGDDTNVKLGEWIEKNNGDNTLIDIDLSSLDGEEVIFTLDVSSRDDDDDNRMFWFVPSIQN